MTKETETLIASDEDLTRLFAGKPTQYRKSKSLPKFTGEAMRTCATINRIFFDDPDEAYRLFHELVPDAGEGVQFTPPFNVDYGIGLTIGRGTFLNKDFMVCGGGYVTLGEDCLIGPRCTIATPNHALDAATQNFAAASLPLFSLSNYPELIKVARQADYIDDEELASLHTWRQDPEHWGVTD